MNEINNAIYLYIYIYYKLTQIQFQSLLISHKIFPLKTRISHLLTERTPIIDF